MRLLSFHSSGEAPNRALRTWNCSKVLPFNIMSAASELTRNRNGGDNCGTSVHGESRACAVAATRGAVIVNADDWGRNVPTTGRSLKCYLRGVVSSVSAMVYMEDSERAADLARQYGIDAGLHLNFTASFSARRCPHNLLEHQARLARFLRSHRVAPVLFHPGLARSFEYVVKAQQEEYERLFATAAKRVDGHHHMHLCANVIFQKLLPEGAIVRRNLTFRPGEKSCLNRLYRRWEDRRLVRRHRVADFFFDLKPLDQCRMKGICELGARFNVEIETHPINDDEYSFLLNGKMEQCANNLAVARGYILSARQTVHNDTAHAAVIHTGDIQ